MVAAPSRVAAIIQGWLILFGAPLTSGRLPNLGLLRIQVTDQFAV